jgi:hypothetical protein
MSQLTDRAYTEITTLCKPGDDLVKNMYLEVVKERYVAALRFLPEKHQDRDSSTLLYAPRGVSKVTVQLPQSGVRQIESAEFFH